MHQHIPAPEFARPGRGRRLFLAAAAVLLLGAGYAAGAATASAFTHTPAAPRAASTPPGGGVSAPPGTGNTYSDGATYGAHATRAQADQNGGAAEFCAGSDSSPAAATDVTSGPYITGSPWYLGCYRAAVGK